MHSNPQWEWFHTRGMCALSSDHVVLSFYRGLYDMLDVKTLIWALWLLIYILPLNIFIRLYSGILVAVHVYIAGFLAPIPAPCIALNQTVQSVFSFDELIVFPSMVMILLHSSFQPLKKELSTWFFWSNFTCVMVCTGCASLITGRSNLLMVGATNTAVLLSYLYAIWTPVLLRLVESVITLILLCLRNTRSEGLEQAFRLALMGTATSLLVPLLFTAVERKEYGYVLSMLIKPMAFLERNKHDTEALQHPTGGLFRMPLLYVLYETILLLLVAIGVYCYQRPLL